MLVTTVADKLCARPAAALFLVVLVPALCKELGMLLYLLAWQIHNSIAT